MSRHRIVAAFSGTPGIALAGAVAAAALPLTRVGIGWPLTQLAILLAVVVGARDRTTAADEPLPVRRPEPAPEPALGPEPADTGEPATTAAAPDTTSARLECAARLAACVLAVALGLTPALRAAGWLTALAVVGALVLGSYALVGGVGWAGVLTGSVGLVWHAGAMANRPVERPRPGGRRQPGAPAVRTAVAVGVGLALVAVFGVLFATADPVFADVVSGWTPELSPAGLARASFALLIGACLTAVARDALRSRPAMVEPDGAPPLGGRRAIRTVEWAIPLVLLDALFAVFVTVQVTVLFGGHRYVLGPGGPTYAEYARGGFGQLLFATVLTLVVLAAVALLAPRETPRQRAAIRLLGGAFAALTLVIVASALKRMWTYADAYGFTRPRLLADTLEVWLGIVLVLVLIAGLRLRARWLPVATLLTAGAVLLGLVAVNPDRLAAQTVVGRFRHDGHLDAAYLARLSADAVPAIDRLPEPARTCVLERVTRDLRGGSDPWYGWNLGRERARDALDPVPTAGWPVRLAPGCPDLGPDPDHPYNWGG
ncbi:hypothetical protein GCM10009682_50680 [Luedemannella flava]|uniref:DUF4173 domain-containing protein n=1 Tax=Luedemannella flava TaxID=349316 RepID=A0ABN2MGH7_9ACTN